MALNVMVGISSPDPGKTGIGNQYWLMV